MLLEHTDGKNRRDQSPSHLSFEGDFTPQNIGLSNNVVILERTVDVNARRSDGSTPLHVASHFRRLEIVRALINQGASVNAENNAGETPLYQVSVGRHQPQEDGICIARLLLEHGGNANACGIDHFGPLHIASSFGMFEMVRLLLDHGADADARSRQGKNSLDLVSRGKYESEEDGVRVAQLLLERGADVNAQDKDRWTPLHSASHYG